MAARPITITVINNTTKNLEFTNAHEQHGTPPIVATGPSSGKLKPGETCSVYAENTGMVGPEGSFSFELENKGGAFNFSYSHPYGKAKTFVHVTTPDGYAFDLRGNLQQHDASCTADLHVA